MKSSIQEYLRTTGFAELIFKPYEAKAGTTVLPLYDTEETKTAGLTARLVAVLDIALVFKVFKGDV